MKGRKWQLFFTLMFASLLVITSCGNNINAVKNLQGGTGEQVIILGDSIASGYGVAAEQAFPNILSRKLGIPILNRGVSGDTTAMGLSRLQADVINAEPWLVMVDWQGTIICARFLNLRQKKTCDKLLPRFNKKVLLWCCWELM